MLIELDAKGEQIVEDLEKEKKKRMMLEKEVDALHKRNTAQMNRLKKQLNEVKDVKLNALSNLFRKSG